MDGDNFLLLNMLGLLLVAALSIGLTALYWRDACLTVRAVRRVSNPSN